MNLIFLGTSAGTPTRERNVSGIILSPGKGRKWFLIDCGEGTQHQLLKTRYSLFNLEAIFITHNHGDHCYGLPGLLAGMAMERRTHPITLVAPKSLRDFIDCLKKSTYLNLTFEINFIDVESLEESIVVGEYKILSYPLSHVVPSFAFRFEELKIVRKLNATKLLSEGIQPDYKWGLLQRGEDAALENGGKLKSLDYLLPRQDPRRVVISGDNDKPGMLKRACNGVQVLIHESTWTNAISEKIGNQPQHCSAGKIAKFAEEIQIPNLILTHFSPRYSKNPAKASSTRDIEKEAQMNYSGTLFLADDFDEFIIHSDGPIHKVEKQAEQ